GPHDLAPALTLAQSLAGEGGLIVVASDRAPADLPASVGILARGRAAPTSGLVDARWIDDEAGGHIALRATAWGGAARDRELALLDGRGAVIEKRVLRLVPGEPTLAVLRSPVGDQPMTAALLGP